MYEGCVKGQLRLWKGETQNQNQHCPPSEKIGLSSDPSLTSASKRQRQLVQANNTKYLSDTSAEKFVLKFGKSNGPVFYER